MWKLKALKYNSFYEKTWAHDRTYLYVWSDCCWLLPTKEDPNWFWITNGDDHIDYPFDAASPTTDLVLIKLLLNSLVSTKIPSSLQQTLKTLPWNPTWPPWIHTYATWSLLSRISSRIQPPSDHERWLGVHAREEGHVWFDRKTYAWSVLMTPCITWVLPVSQHHRVVETRDLPGNLCSCHWWFWY